MIRILICWLLSITALTAQQEATLLGNWSDTSLVGLSAVGSDFNEVWGISINNHEYGLIGSTQGVHVIEINAENQLQERFFLPGNFQGSGVVHRDFKDYQNHLFLVGDQGTASLQIFDYSNLPDTIVQVYNSDSLIQRAHNIFIDTAAAVAYVIGERGQENKRAVVLLDISNPANPKYLNEIGTEFSIFDGHDAYVRDGILYLNAGLEGLYIFDCTNPTNPVLLSQLNIYPQQGYNHSGWLSEDGNYYYMADENFGLDCKVIDVSDKAAPRYVSSFHPEEKDMYTIPHNLVVKDNLLYTAYYFDGLQVFDMNDPENPRLVAYYDTYPAPNNSIASGAWGVFPFLPSGKILLSDVKTGLYVFERVENATSNQSFSEKNPKIYPNPATNYIKVFLDDKHTNTFYELVSPSGQVMKAGQLDNKSQIDINNLQPGLFYCKVSLDSGIFIAPFIKL